MVETLILALLVWLWVIERRLSALLISENAQRLDIESLRMELTKLQAAQSGPHDELQSESKAAPNHPAILEPPRPAAVG